MDLEEALQEIEATEQDLGLEYVGPGNGLNRADRRDLKKHIQRVTRRPVACLQMVHPLLNTLTPHGEKVIQKRRAKSKVAKRSRKKNRR